MPSKPSSDHDLLITLVERVRSIEEKLDTHLRDNSELVRDHENRLRFIEKWVWGAIGIIALIQLIGITTFVAYFTR